MIHQLLTELERQILMLAASALSNKEIGNKLELVEGTVKIHVHNIYRKPASAAGRHCDLVDECREKLKNEAQA